MARNSEIVKNQIRSQQDVAVTDEVRGGAKPKRNSVPQPHVSRQQDATQKFPGTQSRQSKKIDNKRCSNCNKYHARGHCAAYGKICRKCGHYNHFAVCCKTKKGTIDCVPDEPWTIKLHVRDLFVFFKLDTGADLTVIPKSLYNTLGKPKLNKTHRSLNDPGNKKLIVIGSFTQTLSHNGNKKIYTL
jgi:hypothetical protein